MLKTIVLDFGHCDLFGACDFGFGAFVYCIVQQLLTIMLTFTL